MKKINKRDFVTYLLLGMVVILAFVLRVYKLDSNPPSIFWDEASVGYNAWTIAHWGRDEWGKLLPLAFKSFGEYKMPVHIYITSLFELLLGMNPLSVRLPAAILGVANVILIYFLSVKMFQSKTLGLISAVVLAISPYNLQFSRFNHELNIAIFFLLLGLITFLESLEKKYWKIFLAFFFFGLSMISYNAGKIIIPLLVAFLTVIYIKKLITLKKYFYISFIIPLFFILLFVFEPNLLGLSRYNQTQISPREIENTSIFQRTNNMFLGRVEFIATEYKEHFSDRYLFVSGDKNPRHSIQTVGGFYKLDKYFLIAGVLGLLFYIFKYKSKEAMVLLFWVFIAPIPSALVAAGESPHAGRAMFMTVSWHLIIGFGVFTLMLAFKKPILKVLFLVLVVALYVKPVLKYLNDYYYIYPTKYAIEWQYGMKEVFLSDFSKYDKVYVTKERHQPYIFALFYTQTPLPQFLESVEYTGGPESGYNMVAGFDKFIFSGWNFVESTPSRYSLRILTPSQYSGLRLKNDFIVKNLVKYPDGTEAFYVLRGN